MGLFDEISGAVLGGGGMHPQLMSGLAQMFFGQGAGGMQGLMGLFQQQDLGHVLQSWIGTGANLPITPEQITNILGQGNLQALAAGAGLSVQQVSQQLAQHLPGMIDGMTPNGRMPDAGALQGMLAGLFKEQ